MYRHKRRLIYIPLPGQGKLEISAVGGALRVDYATFNLNPNPRPCPSPNPNPNPNLNPNPSQVDRLQGRAHQRLVASRGAQQRRVTLTLSLSLNLGLGPGPSPDLHPDLEPNPNQVRNKDAVYMQKHGKAEVLDAALSPEP